MQVSQFVVNAPAVGVIWRRLARIAACCRACAPGAAALMVISGALLGCAGEPAAVDDRDGVLRLRVGEYRITPQNLRVTARGIAFARIRLVVENVGRLTHTVRLSRIDPSPRVPGQPTAEPPLIADAAVGNLAPGQREISEPFYLAPGKYKIADVIGSYETLGAYGSLTVVAPDG